VGGDLGSEVEASRLADAEVCADARPAVAIPALAEIAPAEAILGNAKGLIAVGGVQCDLEFSGFGLKFSEFSIVIIVRPSLGARQNHRQDTVDYT
jgi:hypothetical protein